MGALCGRYRDAVKARLTDPRDRRRFWDRVLQGVVAERVFSGRLDEADAAMERELAAAEPSGDMGEVYLVGGPGPGDSDLLTFRALRLMQQADVVVYDRLVAAPILDLVRRDAKRVFVGKERNNHTMRQEEINRLLADLVKAGHRVVRLKGGDLFIFGRGGEEIRHPGSAADPLPGRARHHSRLWLRHLHGYPPHPSRLRPIRYLLTGHLKDDTIDLNWQQLAQPSQTAVFHMGLAGLAVIVEKLTAAGVPPDMPIALVQQGTTHNRRVYTSTLSTILKRIAQGPPQPPTLIIVGEVVCLREKLNWFQESRYPDQDATGLPLPGS